MLSTAVYQTMYVGEWKIMFRASFVVVSIIHPDPNFPIFLGYKHDICEPSWTLGYLKDSSIQLFLYFFHDFQTLIRLVFSKLLLNRLAGWVGRQSMSYYLRAQPYHICTRQSKDIHILFQELNIIPFLFLGHINVDSGLLNNFKITYIHHFHFF